MTEKETTIYNLKRSGKSYREIGELYGVSRQRIHQIYEVMRRKYNIVGFKRAKRIVKIKMKPRYTSRDICNLCGVRFYGKTDERPIYVKGRPFCESCSAKVLT